VTFAIEAPVTGNQYGDNYTTKNLAIEAAVAITYNLQIDLDVVDGNQTQVARVYHDGTVTREA
jgi:hypothetical protein